MRLAKTNDGWRRTKDLSNYPCQLRTVNIKGAKGLSDRFSLELHSGISAICGKNGVGKSTILKSIFFYIKQVDNFKTRFNNANVEMSIQKTNNNNPTVVNYIEPSTECNRIISFLRNSDNIEDLIEGVDPNGALSKKENINILGNIIGKVYKDVYIYEVEGALDDDYTFPYIIVALPDGTTYSCLDMGAGEYLCMYIFWYLNWVEKSSILLVDEIENCISVYSQEYLMDYIALMSSSKGIWILLSSHSESILNKVGMVNTKLISNISRNGIDVVSPNHESKYFTALGIKTRKKGIICVEDNFASYFLNYLLNTFSPEIIHDYDIVGLKGGESDIQKLVKHYNPNKNINFSFIAVFDADMHEKIKVITSSTIPVLALPSNGALNPEGELWLCISENISLLANKININEDVVYENIQFCEPLDHHDRFTRLSQRLNVTEETLVHYALSIWLENNSILARKFIFCILLHSLTFAKINPSLLAKNLGIEDILKNLSANQIIDKNKFFFNGIDISLK